MATRGKRGQEPEYIEKHTFSALEIDQGIEKLRSRITEIKKLQEEKIRYDAPLVNTVEVKIRQTLGEIFGTQSRIYSDNDRSEITSRWSHMFGGATPLELQTEFENALPDAIAKYEGFVDLLEEKRKYLPTIPSSSGTRLAGKNGNRVFIMHGLDVANMRHLKQLLKDDWSLEPVVMIDEAPDGMNVFIDKFEKLAGTCSYAIAIFTKDDFVQKSAQGAQAKAVEYYQGRPNVLFELGWFVAKLGRKNVLILVESGTSMPTDLAGVEELRFNSSIDEVFRKIQTSLKNAKMIPSTNG